ncbi:MAG: hypothetical protein ACI8RZ_006559 [Myxococcota bacterium]|jgi:hypothetical protein
MTRSTARTLFLLAATLPWVVMLSTNLALGTPTGTWLAEVCTRACHNGGCHHTPVLPASIAGDTGLFGMAIGGLYGIGGLTGLSSSEGYGAANLAIFCALWPAAMLAMVGIGVRQRVRLTTLRRMP